MHTNVWLTLKWHDFQMRWDPVNYGEINQIRVSPDKYNENEIKLEFEQAEWVDLSEYSASSIWDVMDAPASLVNKRSRIEFQVRIRSLLNSIDDSLRALVILKWAEFTTDIAGWAGLSKKKLMVQKYLLLTFVLNVITILVTVIIINVYFRGPTTHRMPAWVRQVFLEWMPRAMCMQRPKSLTRKAMLHQNAGVTQLPGVGQFTFNPSAHHPFCPSADERLVESINTCDIMEV
ncbi:Neurotransmitter-gated ion-channel transmembrane region [Ancylostoma duodenale]|uniref:Neurotransmitter-gated ion-channel transmembrane region n=1 Tax=Ancylostoma duodenale TaxID=51022 RepID=A0A0C2FQX0_9BILA|nr:Neurotransmitter-gated ion-channel transmembrane region [Ancylostoma duodenale]